MTEGTLSGCSEVSKGVVSNCVVLPRLLLEYVNPNILWRFYGNMCAGVNSVH